MRVLALSGSLRRDSFNTALVRAAMEVAPPGLEIELYEGIAELPHYDADLDIDEVPEAVAELRKRIAAADGLLLATPEYNNSVPGVLKDAIDWASRPFRESALWGKPALVVGTSTNAYGAMLAHADLRKILARAGARVCDGGLSLPKARDSFDAVGRLVDDHARARLAELLGELKREGAAREAAPSGSSTSVELAEALPADQRSTALARVPYAG
jgi:chromate reductase